MNVTLALSPERQAELKQCAASAGTDLSGFILDVVLEKLDECKGSLVEVPYEQWRRDFDSWVASHRPRNPQFDDSRESIYY